MRKTEDIQSIKTIYIPLIEAFLSKKLDPESFARQYMSTLQNDPSITYEDADFEVLQAIFEDADAYDEDPDPKRVAVGLEIDEEEFRRCTRENLEKLKHLVGLN